MTAFSALSYFQLKHKTAEYNYYIYFGFAKHIQTKMFLTLNSTGLQRLKLLSTDYRGFDNLH